MAGKPLVTNSLVMPHKGQNSLPKLRRNIASPFTFMACCPARTGVSSAFALAFLA